MRRTRPHPAPLQALLQYSRSEDSGTAKGTGLTQEQLAEVADISVNFMGYVERGQRAASIQTLERIAQGLNVRPKDLFEFSEGESNEFLYETLSALLCKCTADELRALIEIVKKLGSQSSKEP